MSGWLKQSTTVTVKLGPYVDATDGATAETGLTVAAELSKNGGAFAARNSATATAHDAEGWYGVELNATDTNTLGRLQVKSHEAGALPVWADFMVVPANVWDSLFGADKLQVHADEITAGLITTATFGAGAINAAAIGADAITAAKIADGAIDAATFAAGAINAAAIAADAIGASELAADAVAEIADQVWDEAIAGHLGAGSTGAALNGAGSAGDPWTTALPGAYGAGTAGAIVGALDDSVAAIEADTQDIQARLPAALVSGRIDASVGAMAANTVTAAAIATGAIDADAIAADAIGSSELAATAASEIATAVRSELTTELGRIDVATSTRASQTSVDTVDDFVDTEVGAIKAVTDKLDTAVELDGAVYRFTTNALEQAPSGGGAAPTAAEVADAVWDEAIAGHLGAGSTGAKLNSLAGAAGSGAITHTITVTENGVPIDGALVWITTDAAGTNVVASGFTDALGEVDLFLDAGTYYGWAQRAGTNFINGVVQTVA